MRSCFLVSASTTALVSLLIPSFVAAQTVVAVSGTTAPSGHFYSTFFPPSVAGTGQTGFAAILGGPTSGSYFGFPGSLQTVALQGTPAPSGGNFGGLGASPLANATGQVAFSINLTGGTSSGGIFAGVPGAVQTVALNGTPAPAGGNYNGFNQLVLNGPGQVAFKADLTGGTSSSGVFSGVPGSLQPVALQGTPAPAGGNYNSISGVVLNGAGQVAFHSTLTGGTSTSGGFVGLPGSLQPFALQGNPAPSGGNFTSISSSSINNTGQVAFSAGLTGGSAPSGLFTGFPGSLQTVALVNSPAPAGGNYLGPNRPFLSGTGRIVFSAALFGGSANSGIFAGTPGSMQAIALQGQPAPYFGNYGTLSSTTPVVNGGGQIAFVADLTNPFGTSKALFAGLPVALVKVIANADVIDIDPGPGVTNRIVNDIAMLGGAGGQDGLPTPLSDFGALAYRVNFVGGDSAIVISQIGSVIPEPTSIALIGSFLCGAGIFWYRRQKQKLSALDAEVK